MQDETYAVDALVDLAPPVPKNNLDDLGSGGGSGGFSAPPMPARQPFQYPGYPQQAPGHPAGAGAAAPYPPLPTQNMSEKDLLKFNDGPPPYVPNDPAASSTTSSTASAPPALPSGTESALDLPELPTVPCDTPTHSATSADHDDTDKKDKDDEDIDFDDLTRRFEALKKKK